MGAHAQHLAWGELAAALLARRHCPAAHRPHAGLPSLRLDDPVAVVRCRFAELDGLERAMRRAEEGGRRGGWLGDALSRVEEVGDALALARRGTTLSPAELLAVSDVATAACVVVDGLGLDVAVAQGAPGQTVGAPGEPPGAQAPPDPTQLGESALHQALDGIAAPQALADRLVRSLDRGDDDDAPTLRDSASPALAQARASSRQARRDLHRAAEKMIAGPTVAGALADKFFTEREGRVVLPVKAGSLSRGRGADGIAGIIHGTSARGQTFFVEPTALVDDNNRLRQAQARVLAEEARVLAELTAAVAEQADPLAASQRALVQLDAIAARLALSEALGGRTPQVAPARLGAPLSLPGVRHPGMLLAGAQVVPSDLSLRVGHGLVVSGPNAGGKTVALKTIGLCLMLTHAGVRLPTAAPAEVPLWRRIITDVGDDQSIAANLSTFTAHLHHVMEALDSADEAPDETIVLLDEVAAGTDPEQGAALAEAILTTLVDRGATVVATTHYERLKLLAARSPGESRFANAAVGFDLARLAPTFELTFGVPGSSSALAVARRVGLPDAVVERAQGMLDDRRVQVDALLREVEQQRATLRQSEQALADARAEVERRGAQVDARERGEEAGALRRRAKAHQEATGALRELHGEIRRRRQQLRKAPLSPAPDGQVAKPDAQARAFAGKASRNLAEAAPPGSDPEGIVPDEVAVGDRVHVAGLGARGEVVAVKGTKVTVQLAGLRTTVKRQELRVPGGGSRPTAKAPKAEAEPARAAASGGARRPVRPQLDASAARHFGATAVAVDPGLDDVVDLRGQRAEDALTILEVFLDDALARDRDVIVVKHGHGSGALRKAIREHLNRLRHVADQRPGLTPEGGDAVTVVWVS